MHAKHAELISDLITGTNDRTLTWNPTEVRDQFVLSLPSGVILFDWYSDDEYRRYLFQLVDHEGNTRDEFAIEPDDDAFFDVDDLFQTIKRQITRADEFVESLVGDIRSKRAQAT